MKERNMSEIAYKRPKLGWYRSQGMALLGKVYLY